MNICSCIQILNMKDVKNMIEINKEEATYIRQHGISDGITRVMRQDSKRKKYYLCEDKYLVELLDQYRKSQNVVLTYGEV